jgi:hypothetical protein
MACYPCCGMWRVSEEESEWQRQYAKGALYSPHHLPLAPFSADVLLTADTNNQITTLDTDSNAR